MEWEIADAERCKDADAGEGWEDAAEATIWNAADTLECTAE